MKGLILIVGVIFMTQLDLPMVEGLSCYQCAATEPGCSEAGTGTSAKKVDNCTSCRTNIQSKRTVTRACGLGIPTANVNQCQSPLNEPDLEVCQCFTDYCNSQDASTDYVTGSSGGGNNGPGEDTTTAPGSTSTTIGSTPMLILLGIAGIPAKLQLS